MLPYWIGLLIIMCCLGLEHWIVRKRSIEWAEKSFFRLNAVISMIFLAVVIAEVAFPDFWSFRGI
jgi:4-hydroxybenzoate polyprenyltransferase